MSHKKTSRMLSIMLCMLLAAVMVVQAPAAHACTSIQLESKEGDPYWFRTCDMDNSYNIFGEDGSYIKSSYLVSYPAGVPIELALETLTPEHTIIGTSFSDSKAMLDGINDAGLICGLQNFFEGTQIPLDQIPEDGRALAAMEAVPWFLAQCATVEDVRKLAENTYVNAALVEGVLGSDLAATMHLVFVDANNNSIVLEASDPENPGRFIVYESNGVMGNSPTYAEHLRVLDDYVSNSTELHHNGFDKIVMNGLEFGGKQTGHKTFPASYASGDRFVRLSMMRFLAEEGKNISNEDMLVLGSTMMNTVIASRENLKNVYYYNYMNENNEVQGGGKDTYTQYTVCYDSARRSVAFRPYDSAVWTTLSISDVPTDARTTYPFHRGADGATVSALTVAAAPDSAETEAPAAPTTNVWMYGTIGLGVVVVVLLVLLSRKKQA